MQETADYRIPVINKGDRKAEVLIYDQIGNGFFTEGVTAKNFVNDLNNLGDVDEIDVRINSPGGSVIEGIAIYNALERHSAKINVHIDGAALSMASGIAMAGDTINMAENAMMMVHNPIGGGFGEASDLRKQANVLDKLKDSLTVAYVNRTGKTKDEISDLMTAETWMDADEAVKSGFADNKTEETDVVASFDVPDKYKVPAYLTNVFANLFKPVKAGANKMENDKNAAPETKEPEAATIEQLKSLNGVDKVGNDFIVEQLSNKSTVDQAKDALNAALLKFAEDAEAAKNKAEEEAKKVKNYGVDPLDTKNPKDQETGDMDPEPVFNNSKEVQDEIRDEMQNREDEKRFKRRGAFNHQAAMADIRRKRPELFKNEKHEAPV